MGEEQGSCVRGLTAPRKAHARGRGPRLGEGSRPGRLAGHRAWAGVARAWGRAPRCQGSGQGGGHQWGRKRRSLMVAMENTHRGRRPSPELRTNSSIDEYSEVRLTNRTYRHEALNKTNQRYPWIPPTTHGLEVIAR